jgi:hypothetical protein
MKHAVQDCPLAVCDGSSVNMDEDLLTSDMVRVTFVGENWFPLYRDHYRWHYLNQQKPDEALLLKQYDSDPDAPARCMLALHSPSNCDLRYMVVHESMWANADII